MKHLNKVAAIVIGRILSDRVKEAKFLKPFYKNHYEHPNQSLNPKPAILFIQKPLYLHEIVNEEMIQILDSVQLDFLKLTAELVVDKVEFLSDLNLVQNMDCDAPTRNAAAARMHQAVLECGEYIGTGDYLTFEKFYSAKGLSQTCVTALERFEFIKYFKVANFHMKMNKVFMDYAALMKNEDNIDDKVTLSWCKGWLAGLDIISNQESKIKKTGCYEIHDQFFSELGTQFIANAFKNYIDDKSDNFMVTNVEEAEALILDFLDVNEIRFFYDPNCTSEEIDVFDDLLTYGKDICSRTVLSLMIDKGSN